MHNERSAYKIVFSARGRKVNGGDVNSRYASLFEQMFKQKFVSESNRDEHIFENLKN